MSDCVAELQQLLIMSGNHALPMIARSSSMFFYKTGCNIPKAKKDLIRNIIFSLASSQLYKVNYHIHGTDVNNHVYVL